MPDSCHPDNPNPGPLMHSTPADWPSLDRPRYPRQANLVLITSRRQSYPPLSRRRTGTFRRWPTPTSHPFPAHHDADYPDHHCPGRQTLLVPNWPTEHTSALPRRRAKPPSPAPPRSAPTPRDITRAAPTLPADSPQPVPALRTLTRPPPTHRSSTEPAGPTSHPRPALRWPSRHPDPGHTLRHTKTDRFTPTCRDQALPDWPTSLPHP